MGKSDYALWQGAYWNDPAGFVQDCFKWRSGEGPKDYQLDILRAVPQDIRVAIRAPHSVGKSALFSWLVHWFSLTRDGMDSDWKVATTASKWRQLEDFLWPEIHKWSRRLDWELIGRPPYEDGKELQKLNLVLSTGKAFAIASDTPSAVEGAHADHLMYLFDEAKAIQDETFDAIEGAFMGAGADTQQEAFAVVASTPGEPDGRFFNIHSRKPGYEDWSIKVVTLDDAIRAGQISREKAEQRKRQWGELSQLYQNRVLGQFASRDENGLIPLAHVEAANERWLRWANAGKPGYLHRIGVDPSDQGADKTVFALRFVSEMYDAIDDFKGRVFSQEDTMETANRTAGLLKNKGGSAIVDSIGLGGGVFNRLRELGLPVEAFIGSEKTSMLDNTGEMGFTNKRTAAWWNMRELLDPANGFGIALPPDELLIADLIAPRVKAVEGGKYQLESKDAIRKRRSGRSTDYGDAVVMAYWEERRQRAKWRVL